MNILRFLDWPMYKDAKKLNFKITEISKSFSLEIKIKYGRQLNRAALSVCLNIAEGAGRFTDLEMSRFFDISLGSLSEVIACADNLRDEGFLNNSIFDDLKDDALNIAKQIQGMQHKVLRNPHINKRF